MRGLRRSRVWLARKRPLSSSTSLKRRWRNLGLAGGKSSGGSLFASQQLDVAGEGQLVVRHSVTGGPLVQQPAHGIVRQYPAVELLAHQLGCLAAQHPAASQQVSLQLVKQEGDIVPVNISRATSLCATASTRLRVRASRSSGCTTFTTSAAT